jgi:hypothetical protein
MNLQDAAQELINAVREILDVLTGRDSMTAADLPTTLTELARYAWEGQFGAGGERRILELLHVVSTPVELLRGVLMSPSGDQLLSKEAQETIAHVANAAAARHELDQGSSVTIEQLAALTRVSERTIRAATNSKNPNAIPITKDGHWTRIEAEDALRWLSRRSDFVPTQPIAEAPNAYVIQTSRDVGIEWEQWRKKKYATVESAASALGWTTEEARLYADLEATGVSVDSLRLTPRFWNDFAADLGATDPEQVAAMTYHSLAKGLALKQIKADLPSVS